MRYQKKWINRFMIYQKIFVDILLLFNGMILNYLYFHFYDSRYILRLSQFQKMLIVCLLALMFVFVYSDFGYCSYIFTSLLAFYLFVFSIILKRKANILPKSIFLYTYIFWFICINIHQSYYSLFWHAKKFCIRIELFLYFVNYINYYYFV